MTLHLSPVGGQRKDSWYRSVRLGQKKKSEMFGGIEIQGGPEFLARTREALELLGPTSFSNEIERYIAVIKEGKRSGMKAYARRPTFVVGKPTWDSSTLWYAGAIAHDCHHSKLYHEAKSENGSKAPERDAWTGKEAEKKCLSFQLEVLREVNADNSMIAYIERLSKNPTYQGHNRGWRAWWDYFWRTW